MSPLRFIVGVLAALSAVGAVPLDVSKGESRPALYVVCTAVCSPAATIYIHTWSLLNDRRTS